MKGYRTIAFSIAVILLGLAGKHVKPDLVNEYLDVIFAAIGLGFLVLRLITDTPFGAKVAADLGTTPADLKQLLSRLDPDMPQNLSQAVTELRQSISLLAAHAPAQSVALDKLEGLVSALGEVAFAPAETDEVKVAADPDPSPTPVPVPSPAPTPVQ